MTNFKILTDLPNFFNLQKELDILLSNGDINWVNNNQICLNTTAGDESNYAKGCGSLTLDWDNKKETTVTNGTSQMSIPLKTNRLRESDFTSLCSQFAGTEFETIYSTLKLRFILGRVRLMRLEPKTCLSWHHDTSFRLHYPIKTQPGCFMVINNEVKHLEKNTWYMTNTLHHHTVFNGSLETRIHLVASILNYEQH